MDKEKEPKFESGFSEKQADLAVDQGLVNDQVKPARNANASVAGGGGSIFDPQKKKKKNKVKGGIILDSQSQ